MAYLVKQLPADNTNIANFIAWGSGISSAFVSAGWAQTTDIGQAVWIQTVVAITGVVGNGSLAVYTYTLTSGPALRVGMSLTVVSCTTAGFNGTFSLIGLGSGTFTTNNMTNLTESETATATTTVVILPTGLGVSGYEIFKSTDALSTQLPIYIKIEYGANYAVTGSNLGFTVSTGSDGMGNLTGQGLSRVWQGDGSKNTGSTGVWECDFSWYGSGSSFAMMLWRNLLASGTTGAPNNSLPIMFVVERSHDANGDDTAEYFTVVVQMCYNLTIFAVYAQAVNGAPGQIFNTLRSTQQFPAPFMDTTSTSVGSLAYLVPVFPICGKIGNPMRMLALGKVIDFADGSVIPMPLYGITQNYLMSNQAWYNQMNFGCRGTTPGIIGIRWDVGA